MSYPGVPFRQRPIIERAIVDETEQHELQLRVEALLNRVRSGPLPSYDLAAEIVSLVLHTPHDV